MRLTTAAALTLSLLAVPAFARPFAKHKDAVVVHLKTSSGEDAGTATFTPSKDDKLTINLKLKNLPAGDHAVHIHQNAKCDAPDFKSAGGHFNPAGKQHGTMNPMGHHNGDLPQNIAIGPDHTGMATFTVDYLSLNLSAADSLYANGGTSIMVHEKADDMKTDPTGNAGNRIACGVITAPTP
ncbi:superoxide dismutase family protein [Edaphobacter bradus]|uniref:superoxide dismutase family protein n=1 Tax=Edaphobacter bradus TaxID=2259016 RepID=UPI0021E0662D|nr:superoxide dismutase family protein [Edaphobacter bradus]